jgi:hypothetical protein
MIQLRRPNRRTPPTAHSRMRRSSRDPIRSSRLCAPMLAAPFPPCVAVSIRLPHSASPPPVPRSSMPRPIPCDVLRATSSVPHSPPGLACLARAPPRCLLATAGPLAVTASTELASRGHLHRVDEPPQRMLQQTGEEGQDSCDTAPTSELSVPLLHSEVLASSSTSASVCLHSSKQSPYCKSMFQVFQMFHLDVEVFHFMLQK